LAFTVTTLEKSSSLGKASESGFMRFKPCAVDSVTGENHSQKEGLTYTNNPGTEICHLRSDHHSSNFGLPVMSAPRKPVVL
jgi:hypothetical protein